jgi:hypothetical protein
MIALFSALSLTAAFQLSERFEQPLCVSPCPGALWAFAQRVEGGLDIVSLRGKGRLLRARAGPRLTQVPKAALVARPGKIALGSRLQVALDVMIPVGTPLNSIHLIDVECAKCGSDGNPGIRVYLRDGRLRIDRAKIGEANAWTNENAPKLSAGTWHRIRAVVTPGRGRQGRAQVFLDGAEVLDATGSTIVQPGRGSSAGADRVQIGVTANSNSRAVTAYFDNVEIRVSR